MGSLPEATKKRGKGKDSLEEEKERVRQRERPQSSDVLELLYMVKTHEKTSDIEVFYLYVFTDLPLNLTTATCGLYPPCT